LIDADGNDLDAIGAANANWDAWATCARNMECIAALQSGGKCEAATANHKPIVTADRKSITLPP